MRAQHEVEHGRASWDTQKLQKRHLYVQEDRRYLQCALPQQPSRRQTGTTSSREEGAAMSTKKTAKNEADLQHALPGIESTFSQREQLAIISRIPANPLHEELLIPNYQPDRAIRE